MKAVAISGFGGADRVGIVDVPPPPLGAGEVMIAARFAGLNPADWKLRDGWLAGHFVPAFPFVLGFDVAGVVVACGPGVPATRHGERVAAKTAAGRGGPGGCAELVAVPAHLACPIAGRLTFDAAAAIPTAAITAWEALCHVARLRAGQTVFVNGAAGGTGSFAVAIARAAGAVVAATGRPANHAYLAALGADLVVDYRREDLAAVVHARFPGGVDVLLDTVGQGTAGASPALVRDGGTLVTIATLAPGEASPPAARGITVATAMSNRAREGGQLAAIVAAAGDGHLALPAIERVPAAGAAAALERLRLGHVRGKLVVDLAVWQ